MQKQGETSEAKPTGRRRRSPSERRAQILTEAVRICESEGLDAVTIRRVTSELGIAAPLANHYFGSADGLVAQVFLTVTGDQLAQLREVIEASSTPTGAIGTLIHLLFDGEGRGTDTLWFDAARLSRENPELHETFVTQDAQWLSTLAHLFEAGMSSGEFRRQDPVEAAQKCWILVDGLFMRRSAHSIPSGMLLSMAQRYVEFELGLLPGVLSGGPLSRP